MLSAIVGVNWGDEGKGRMVDLLSSHYDVVVRYQGGSNAGHTVINKKGKFVLNLLPSGILRPECVNILGNGVLIDLEHLNGEIARAKEQGVEITPAQLKISERACICMPYHKLQDNLEEDRLADAKFGSTRRGIAYGYADKYMKKALRMEDLRDLEATRKRLEGIAEWKDLTLNKGYGAEKQDVDALMKWLETYGTPLLGYVCDTTDYLEEADKAGKNILFEAQLGSLRDIDLGIYPYTTSSNTLAAYAPIGAGVPNLKISKVLGIAKAYSSCVGEGPFVVEMFGDEGHALREAGGEYGAATGRPRRIGAFDIVATRYGAMLQGADSIALTKLDVLSYMDQIPVCTAYKIDGELVHKFPTGARLEKAEPVIEYLPGFKCDITNCRQWEDLPKAAQDYVLYIEKAIGVPIGYVSVGAERDQIIYR